MNKNYMDDSGEVGELDDAFFKNARRGRPPLPEGERKSKVTLMLDQDVIERLKGPSPKGWQTRLNATLRDALDLE